MGLLLVQGQGQAAGEHLGAALEECMHKVAGQQHGRVQQGQGLELGVRGKQQGRVRERNTYQTGLGSQLSGVHLGCHCQGQGLGQLMARSMQWAQQAAQSLHHWRMRSPCSWQTLGDQRPLLPA